MSPFQAVRRHVPIALAALLCACERAAPAPRAWPADTVLALNDVAIARDDVDEVAGWIAMIEPTFALPHLRRLALTNVIFPRIAAQNLDPARRTAVADEARAFRASLDRGEAPVAGSAAPRELKGTYRELGMELWRNALELEIGRWSPIVEATGAYYIEKVIDRGTSVTPGGAVITLSVFMFPYLDPEKAKGDIDAALDRSTLTYVDESWRELVPTQWQYRMRGHQP